MSARPPVGWTPAVLTTGTLLSAACFIVGLGLTVMGGASEADNPQPLDGVLRGVLELQPTSWSTLGVLVLLATPAAGLLSTFVEMRRRQPRSALLALVVLGILAAATVIAAARA